MITKIRAWDKEEESWIDIKYLGMIEGEITILESWDDDLPYFIEDLGKTWELMQFTGLTDKNGKEIFEGDVIRIEHPFRGSTHIGEVIKEAYTYNVKDFYFSHYDIPGDAFSEGTEYMEVIGNIHEHSHLLDDGGNL